MTVLDDKILPKVLSVITKYGKDIRVAGNTGGTHNPATRKYTGGTPISVTLKASPPDKYDRSLVNGESIQADDLYVILPAQGLSFTPTNQFTVEFDSDIFTIISVSPMYSGELIAAYKLQLRG